MSRPTIKYLAVLLLTVVIFYWRFLLTHQFSLLTGAEGVNQAYAWLTFWVRSIWNGVLPLWDPYVFGGRSFSGEMQTAAFYPLNLLFALVPFNRNGVLSPSLYHISFALTHFLATCFMFALARELQLSRFAALLSAICFSMGGLVGTLQWPHMLGSAIWMPVLFLFVIRSARQESLRRSLLYAAGCGLILGVSTLAGGLHIVMMQALTVVSVVVFCAAQAGRCGLPITRRPWHWAGIVLVTIAAVAFAAGAVQLLPSMEYSARAIRFLGDISLPADQKIPYAYLRDGLFPHGLVLLIFPWAYGGHAGTGEILNPYIGVLPLLLAAIGIWKGWANPWVRYATGLAGAAFLLSLGAFSLAHGITYAAVPFLWMAREAGRWLYLMDFALAILVAYGANILFSTVTSPAGWSALMRPLTGIVIALGIALAVPALFAKLDINPWISFSILMIVATYALFRYVVVNGAGATTRFLAVALVVFDLNAFDWTSKNKIDAGSANHLERILSFRGAADFLKSRPGHFRVQVLADPPANIGDVFGIQTTWGGGVTLPANYSRLMSIGNRAIDLLNVRYVVKPASASDPGPIFADANWKVYENQTACPRVWIVHETEIPASTNELLQCLAEPEADPRQVAFLEAPLQSPLEPAVPGEVEKATVTRYTPNGFEVQVRARSRGLLILSELFYPGWRATVNERPTDIVEVDAAIRGVVVPAGHSTVSFQYAPKSVFYGAALTIATFLTAAVIAGKSLFFRNV